MRVSKVVGIENGCCEKPKPETVEQPKAQGSRDAQHCDGVYGNAESRVRTRRGADPTVERIISWIAGDDRQCADGNQAASRRRRVRRLYSTYYGYCGHRTGQETE